MLQKIIDCCMEGHLTSTLVIVRLQGLWGNGYALFYRYFSMRLATDAMNAPIQLNSIAVTPHLCTGHCRINFRSNQSESSTASRKIIKPFCRFVWWGQPSNEESCNHDHLLHRAVSLSWAGRRCQGDYTARMAWVSLAVLFWQDHGVSTRQGLSTISRRRPAMPPYSKVYNK